MRNDYKFTYSYVVLLFASGMVLLVVGITALVLLTGTGSSSNSPTPSPSGETTPHSPPMTSPGGPSDSGTLSPPTSQAFTFPEK